MIVQCIDFENHKMKLNTMTLGSTFQKADRNVKKKKRDMLSYYSENKLHVIMYEMFSRKISQEALL